MAKISIDLKPAHVNRTFGKNTGIMTPSQARVPFDAALIAFDLWGDLGRSLELIKISWEDESFSQSLLLWLKFLVIVKEPGVAEKIEVRVDFRYPRPYGISSSFEMYWEGKQQYGPIDPNLEYDPVILADYLKQAVLSKIKERIGEVKSRGSKLEKLTASDAEVTV